jgi:hypothetical protein
MTENLSGATPSFLSIDQYETLQRNTASSASAVLSLGDDTKMVRLSAYEAMLGGRHWDIRDEMVKKGRQDDRALGNAQVDSSEKRLCSQVEAGCLPASEVAAKPADQVVM